MKIIFSKRFNKSYRALDARIQKKVDETLLVFLDSPLDSTLRNHKLSWPFRDMRSIDVTWDYRIVIYQMNPNTYEIVELIDVGTHSQLYG